MLIIETPAHMQAWSQDQRKLGKSVGFVPTMGALHHGHTTLIDACVQSCNNTVLSIFVNPAQFNVSEDFQKYPRTFDTDIHMAKKHKVDVVYAPNTDTMYPPGFNSYVEPPRASAPMEGAGRPGHFRGVTTVVLKLLHAVEPNVAFFGKKDYQQLAVIRQMVSELDMSVRIEGIDTVRDSDGLALSSRNVRLTEQHRSQAPIIYAALQKAEASFSNGERSATALEEIVSTHIRTAPDASLEYVQAVDAKTLERHSHVNENSVICVACWFGDVRLIDNLELFTAP